MSLAALAIGAAIYAYAHKDEGALTESKERGALIVAALERYRADHGDYPPTLDELAPEYADSIAPPTWGLGRWRYERYARAPSATALSTDSLFFTLSVAARESGYPLLFYDITARRWVLNN